MADLFNAVGLILVAYLLASVPFGVIVGRLATGGDIRAHGSGHSGATNVVRQAGWRVGIVVALLDVAKAFAGVWLARKFGSTPWVAALAGVRGGGPGPPRPPWRVIAGRCSGAFAAAWVCPGWVARCWLSIRAASSLAWDWLSPAA
jgi:acyl-phosphate glycerol 3-phosphate acyltransferase